MKINGEPVTPVVYVAGAFRGKHAWAIAQNIRAAEEIGFEVASMGAMPLIPHANTAQFAGTLTDEFWLAGTMELLRRCDAVIALSNWVISHGAQAEIVEAKRIGIPVFHRLWELKDWLEGKSGGESEVVR